MPAKTPMYLKTPTPRRGSRKPRLRDVLSGDMISPPLGDFRHRAHIGPDGEGDMFGELGFLQGRSDLLPGWGLRRGAGQAGGGCRALLKSAVSLPAFGGAVGPDQAPPKPPRLHLDGAHGGGQLQPRSMSVSGAAGLPFASSSSSSLSAEGGPPSCGTPPPRSESLLRLDLDLGPSFLDDVLRIMDGYQLPGAS